MEIFKGVVQKLTVALCVVWCSSVFALPPKKVFITTGAVEHGVPSGTAKPLFSLGLGPFSLQLGVQQQWGHLPAGQMPQTGMTGTTNITLPSLTVLVPNAVLNVSGLQQPGAQPPVVWVVPVPNGGAAPVPAPMQPDGGTGASPGTVQPVPAPMPMPMPPPQVPWETTTMVVVPGQQQPPVQPGGDGGGGGSGSGGGGGGGGGDGGGYIITETTDSMGNVVQTITPVGQPPNQQPGQTIVVPGQTTVVEEVVNYPPNQPGVTGLIRRGVVNRLTGMVLQRNNTKPIINFIKGQ